MRIVILDSYTANPGDLSWSDFDDLGEVVTYDRTTADQIVERCQGAEVVLTNKVPLSAKSIAALPDLTYIGVCATGYNIIDTAAAQERGIAVTNVPGYSSNFVAQTTFAHILELCNHVALHAEAVNNGDWAKSEDFCFWRKPLVELNGLTLGLVGFGEIAQAVAKIAQAMGMKIIVHTRTPRDVDGIDFVDADTLFSQADVISLHCPLTPETKHLINAERLQQMKKTAILINTSRGPLIDEEALAKALYAEEIAGAGLDVLSSEPPEANNPLQLAPNCFITPHIAWASRAARQRLIGNVCMNLEAFVAGTKKNRIV